MEPKTVAASLLAQDDRGCLGEPEPAFCFADFQQERLEVTCRDGADSGLLRRADRERELPGSVAELKGQVEDGGQRRGRINRVSR